MAADERVTLLLGIVPANIRRKAFQAAKRAKGNLNDEIVRVLSEKLGVEFVGTGKPAPPGSFKPGDRKMLLRVSETLDRAVLQAAVDAGTNKTTYVNQVLAEHYGVKYRPLSSRRSPVGGGRQQVAA